MSIILKTTILLSLLYTTSGTFHHSSQCDGEIVTALVKIELHNKPICYNCDGYSWFHPLESDELDYQGKLYEAENSQCPDTSTGNHIGTADIKMHRQYSKTYVQVESISLRNSQNWKILNWNIWGEENVCTQGYYPWSTGWSSDFTFFGLKFRVNKLLGIRVKLCKKKPVCIAESHSKILFEINNIIQKNPETISEGMLGWQIGDLITTTLHDFPYFYISQPNPMTVYFPENQPLEINTQLKIACPETCEKSNCEIIITIYHCPPCSSESNGGFPALLPRDGFISGSCTPKFRSGGKHGMVGFYKVLEPGEVYMVPKTIKHLSNFALYVRFGGKDCSEYENQHQCARNDKCKWDEEEGCVPSWCHPVAPHGPPQCFPCAPIKDDLDDSDD